MFFFSLQTKFSHDEIEKWARGFQRDCPTGKLQKSEFVKIYNEFFPDGDATKFSQFVFDVFVMNVHQIFTFFSAGRFYETTFIAYENINTS